MPDAHEPTATAHEPQHPTATGPTPPAGETIDAPAPSSPYTDLTPHARGGLGEVFRGTDPVLHRTVAVKRLLDRHADRPDSRRRFVLEAEITARLEHPGVVPVYGLFAGAGGRPAYAMRFVQGSTLADAIRGYHAGRPDPVAFRRLLQAFLQVCNTVAFAHSRGVIHRDLKPSNVMLGRFGETLVVDWGLAKVVGRPEGAKAEPAAEETLVPESGSGGETQMGSAVGTPAYMSPEQAAGRWDVTDHRSDVYGLGAVLYTVLTGKPPLEGGNWPEQQQRIQRGDFPRPRQAAPGVPKSLEAVVLRAMAPDPAARYASAEALAADVEHWLAGEPVSAYREPVSARAWRWVRWHRTLATAAAVLLVSALAAAGAGLVLLGQKNREVAGERNAARRAADEAGAVNAFLTDDLLGQADPDVNSRDKKVTVEDVVAKAAARIDGSPTFADKPAVEATLRLAIGKTYYKLANYAEAERHLRRAADLRRDLLGPDHRQTLVAEREHARAVGELRPGEAVGPALRAWEALGRVAGPEDPDTLNALLLYCETLFNTGRPGETVDLHRTALDLHRRVLGEDDPATLIALQQLGNAHAIRGDVAGAAAAYRELLARAPGQFTRYEETASNLGFMLYVQGELAEAERVLAVSVDRLARRRGPDDPSTDRTRGLLVRVRIDRGKPGEAAEDARRIEAARRTLYPADHFMRGNAAADLGWALVLLGRPAEAEPKLAEALRVYAASPPQTAYQVAWARCWYGVCLAEARRYDAAEGELRAAERELATGPLVPRRHYRQAVGHLVKLYDAWGKPDRAAEWRAKLAADPGGQNLNPKVAK